ncbi:MAG: POTRA domain-containing protein, partial [Desulfomonilia bacterium]
MKTAESFSTLFTPVAAWLIMCLWALPCPAGVSIDKTLTDISEVLRIHEINIHVQDTSTRHEELVRLASDLITLEEGQYFRRELLDESITSLELSDRFGDIDIDGSVSEAGLALTFSLTPFRLISDIQISGQYPLFSRDILKAMTVYTGDSFTHDTLPTQEKLITDLYLQEGFISPAVRITTRDEKDTGSVILFIEIDEGPYLRISSIVFDGNRAFSDSALRFRMHAWRTSLLPGSAGRFKDLDLKKDIESLNEYYWNRGFPECRITSSVEKDTSSGTVMVSITISEGPRYTVSFTGNSEFSDRTLKKDLVFFQEGGSTRGALKKSTRKIEQRYLSAGYSDVSVALEESSGKDETGDLRSLEFIVHEGPRTQVGSVHITGNQAIGEEALREEMLTRPPGFLHTGVYVEETLAQDLTALQSLYLNKGFPDAAIEHDLSWSEDRTRVDIAIRITEHTRILVEEIRFEGLTIIPYHEAIDALMMKEGDAFRRYLVKSGENTLATLISENGYPYVQVTGEVQFIDEGSRATVVYRIDEGPYVTMGNIYYRGNFRTQHSILDAELDIEPGEAFSLRHMLQGQKDIRDMGIFNSVQFKTIGLKEQRERITLLADMEEIKPYYVQAGVGYESDRGVYGHGRLGDRNLLGLNKNAWIGGEISQIGYRAESGITEPRLFGSRVSSSFGIFSEKRQEFNQDFGTTVLGSTLNFTRAFEPFFRTALGLRYERRNQFLRNSDDSIDPGDEDDPFKPRGILVVTPTIMFDTRDSFVIPRSGIFSSLSVDISKGLENSLDNFFKYMFDLRYYLTPVDRITLAWLGRAGYIDPYGPSENIPDDQLFYVGGTLDVRGFDENMLRYDSLGDPLGGRIMLVSSIEARIELLYNFELTCFFDTGSVRETADDSVSEGFRS